MTERDMTPDQQGMALATLRYVRDLLTASPKEQYSRDELLVLLKVIEDDQELFDPKIVIQMDEIDKEFEVSDAGK